MEPGADALGRIGTTIADEVVVGLHRRTGTASVARRRPAVGSEGRPLDRWVRGNRTMVSGVEAL
jgi:hypothetical protein